MISGFQQALRDARSLARSLVYEGYLYVFESYDKQRQSLFIKLRHQNNRNIMSIQVRRNEWWATKNDKTIKKEVC